MPEQTFSGIIDGHEDVPYALLHEDRDFFQRSAIGQVDLPRLKEGGVRAAFFALYEEEEYLSIPVERCLQAYDCLRVVLERGEGEMVLVRNVSDLTAANAAGKFAVILHAEGAEPVNEDMTVLHALYDLGLRSLGITWSRTNRFAEGVGDANQRLGLTGAGVKLVKECNRMGVIVDVSHLNEEGFWDVIKTSTRPVIATHSNAWAICPHIRNLKDDQLRAIADSGGTVGINFHTSFLRPDLKEDPQTDPGILADHVDYIAGVAGIDHVAFGSDYDGAITPPAGMENVSRFPRLIEVLRQRGYDDGSLQKMMSGNLIRVFRDTWR